MRRGLTAPAGVPSDAARALRDLRRARRRRAYGDIDWSDALYKAYVTAIFSAIGASIVSGYIGGEPVTPAQLATVTERRAAPWPASSPAWPDRDRADRVRRPQRPAVGRRPGRVRPRLVGRRPGRGHGDVAHQPAA